MYIEITSHETVNGVRFGAPEVELLQRLGPADEALQNYTGEWELRYGDSFYRFAANHLVEATFPASCRFNINGIAVVSMFAWLHDQPDTIDVARFRVSRALGLAYDNRFEAHGSITAFAAGHWDALLSGH